MVPTPLPYGLDPASTVGEHLHHRRTATEHSSRRGISCLNRTTSAGRGDRREQIAGNSVLHRYTRADCGARIRHAGTQSAGTRQAVMGITTTYTEEQPKAWRNRASPERQDARRRGPGGGRGSVFNTGGLVAR